VIGLLADCFITFFLLVVTRVVMITVYHYVIHSVSTSRDQVLIYMNGAENNVLTSSLISKLGRYQVAGYISLDRDASIRIAGYRLFGPRGTRSLRRWFKPLLQVHPVYKTERCVSMADRMVRTVQSHGTHSDVHSWTKSKTASW
jgi:hypothetical protein